MSEGKIIDSTVQILIILSVLHIMYRVSQNEEGTLMEKCQIPIVISKCDEGGKILYYHIMVFQSL
jgi:hypothetical protein